MLLKCLFTSRTEQNSALIMMKILAKVLQKLNKDGVLYREIKGSSLSYFVEEDLLQPRKLCICYFKQ